MRDPAWCHLQDFRRNCAPSIALSRPEIPHKNANATSRSVPRFRGRESRWVWLGDKSCPTAATAITSGGSLVATGATAAASEPTVATGAGFEATGDSRLDCRSRHAEAKSVTVTQATRQGLVRAIRIERRSAARLGLGSVRADYATTAKRCERFRRYRKDTRRASRFARGIEPGRRTGRIVHARGPVIYLTEGVLRGSIFPCLIPGSACASGRFLPTLAQRR